MGIQHMDLISAQPYLMLAAAEVTSFPYSNSRLVTGVLSAILETAGTVSWIPDCFSTLLLHAEGAQPPLLITPCPLRQEVGLLSGRYYILRFSPLASYCLYRVYHDIPDFSSRQIPAIDIFPELEDILPSLQQSFSVVNNCHALLQFFQTKLSFAPVEPRCAHILQQILVTNGKQSVPELAHSMFFSTRYIHKLLCQNIGFGYKTLVRILRIHNVIYAMTQAQDSLTLPTPYNFYYDQSHYLREFKQLCGKSPREIRGALAARPQTRHFTGASSLFPQ